MPNAKLNSASRPATEASGETAASLGAQLLSLLPTLRLHSVSIFDAKGDVQWLSEGALGPDEQSVVETTLVTLSAATSRAHLQAVLADNRAALFLAVRTPRMRLAGVVMVLMDAKILSSGNLAARILTTSMRSVLQKIALLLVPPPPLSATATSTGIRTLLSDTQTAESALLPHAHTASTADNPVAGGSVEWIPAAQALDILEPAAADRPAPGPEGLPWTVPPEAAATAVVPAAARAAGDADTANVAVAPALWLRELLPLRAGSRTRRYQVVPVAEQQRGDALTTLGQLLTWLRQNPSVLQGDPISFTIGVSARALADPELPAALGRVLASAALTPETIGFELRESACVSHRAQAEDLLAQCEESQCFAVIDNFTFNTAVLDLLRSRAVRMLKLEARLVAAVRHDKLAQARVTAIAQAAKVLGIHCAAKYVESQSSRRWLSAVGFDFTQSSTVEPLQRLAEPPAL